MKRWLLALVSTLLSLVLIEAALQGLSVAKDIRRGRRMGRLSQDPVLGYELKPGWRKGRIRINRLGFRGREMDAAKPSDTYRIVVLGDSLPFGVTLDEGQVFPTLLEAALNAAPATGGRVEVVNAAVGGYNVTQYRGLYRSRIRPLRPDQVVLSLCQNDFTPSGPYRLDWTGVVRGDLDEGASRAFPDNVILVRKVKLLATRLAKTADPRAPGAGLSLRAPTFTLGWEFGGTALGGLIADVQGDGVGLLVLVFPYRFQLGGRETSTDARLSQFLSRQGGAFLDFLDPFRQAGGELFLPGDELHFNAEGHRFIAETLTARLKRTVRTDPASLLGDAVDTPLPVPR